MHSEGSLDGRVIGEIGVAIAVERLLRAGFHVAIPIIDDGYDLLAFAGRQHWRIQVKASNSSSLRERNRIRISRGKARTSLYCASHVDAFIAVNIRTGVVMCVPVAKTRGKRWLNWRDADRWSDLQVLRQLKTQRC